MFLIRTLHKWFGLIVGLQLVLWTLSGAVMALLDHHKVAAEDAVLAVARLPVPQVLSLDRISSTLGEPILKLELKPLYDRYVYEVTTPKGVRLIDAVSAAPVVVDAAAARTFAVARFSGQAEPTSVTLVEKATLETRKLKTPVWRVEFGDSERHTFLVSPATGEVLDLKNDSWRLFDIAWMLHIMDYDDRENFNHPLIVTVAMAAAWLALSGLILLFRAFRRSDFAWLLDRASPKGRVAGTQESRRRPPRA